MEDKKEEIIINSEQSLKTICNDIGIPFPSNNISEELKEYLKDKIIVMDDFWNLNTSHLLGIFHTLYSEIILKKDDLLSRALDNRIGLFKNINFDNQTVNLTDNIKINDCKFNYLELMGGKKIEINYDDASVLHTENEYSLRINGWVETKKIRIYSPTSMNPGGQPNLKIRLTWITGADVNTSRFSIHGFNIESLILEDCVFDESFTITNCDIEKMYIVNSQLWKTRFNWLEIWELYLENADITDVIFNSNIFKNYELIYDVWNKPWRWVNNIALKDNYRQLKYVMDKNWNHTEANKFYAKEMEMYWKTLKLFSMDFFNKIIFVFQNVVSSFWNSWFRVFFIIFVFSFASWWIDFLYSNENNRISFWEYPNYQLVNYLNPIFTLPEYVIVNNERGYISYNWLEVLWFIVFKLIYWSLVYQLIISIKRTTRR